MKRYYYFICLLFFLASCTTSYQIFDVDSTQVQEVPAENVFIFENDSLEIVYDLWTDGGTLLYRVQNKLNVPLEIAMDKSYFGFQRDKVNYYRPAEQDERLLEPPNPELAYSPFGRYDPIVTIPAGEGRWLEGFPITYQRLRLRKGEPLRFTEKDSPIQFANYLNIVWESAESKGKAVEIRHDFWVTRVNQINKKALRSLTESDIAKADKFYVSPAPEERPGVFWMEVGLGVLENMIWLFF